MYAVIRYIQSAAYAPFFMHHCLQKSNVCIYASCVAFSSWFSKFEFAAYSTQKFRNKCACGERVLRTDTGAGAIVLSTEPRLHLSRSCVCSAWYMCTHARSEPRAQSPEPRSRNQGTQIEPVLDRETSSSSPEAALASAGARGPGEKTQKNTLCNLKLTTPYTPAEQSRPSAGDGRFILHTTSRLVLHCSQTVRSERQ